MNQLAVQNQNPLNSDHANREKRRVAASSLAAAVVLTVGKLIIGIYTNSLGILSEAAHSALDLVAAAVTLWAVRISARPADHDHAYGHGKIENLSALFETGLLLATCVWIVWEAVARLFCRAESHVDANAWAFLIVIASIVIDISRSRALMRVAKKYGSQALEADALHFSTDVWSSMVVLLGLFGVLAGGHWEQVRWLEKADSVAALGVAVIVIGVSIQLGRRCISELLDAVPADLHAKISAAAAAVSGVREVKQVRARRSGPEVFADIIVTVDHGAAFENAHDVADAIERAVKTFEPAADVMVHVEPAPPSEPEDVPTRVRLLASRLGLSVHNLRFNDSSEGRTLELHLEVESSLRLEQAHEKATQLEQAVRQAIPDLAQINTHIEPAAGGKPGSQVQWNDDAVSHAVAEFLRSQRIQADSHDLQVHRDADGQLSVSLHCELAAEMPIADAHDVTQRLETFLRKRIQHLGRVLIHVEPAKP